MLCITQTCKIDTPSLRHHPKTRKIFKDSCLYMLHVTVDEQQTIWETMSRWAQAKPFENIIIGLGNKTFSWRLAFNLIELTTICSRFCHSAHELDKYLNIAQFANLIVTCRIWLCFTYIFQLIQTFGHVCLILTPNRHSCGIRNA